MRLGSTILCDLRWVDVLEFISIRGDRLQNMKMLNIVSIECQKAQKKLNVFSRHPSINCTMHSPTTGSTNSQSLQNGKFNDNWYGFRRNTIQWRCVVHQELTNWVFEFVRNDKTFFEISRQLPKGICFGFIIGGFSISDGCVCSISIWFLFGIDSKILQFGLYGRCLGYFHLFKGMFVICSNAILAICNRWLSSTSFCTMMQNESRLAFDEISIDHLIRWACDLWRNERTGECASIYRRVHFDSRIVRRRTHGLIRVSAILVLFQSFRWMNRIRYAR